MIMPRKAASSAMISNFELDFNEGLALEIEDYWRKRGHEVETTVEHMSFASQFRCRPCVVRSDMVNGYPASLAKVAPKAGKPSAKY